MKNFKLFSRFQVCFRGFLKSKLVSILGLISSSLLFVIWMRSFGYAAHNFKENSGYLNKTKISVIEDYGDCQAIGPRRPSWADRNEMKSSLHEFSRIYDRRPFRENKGGMRFHHSFGLWYTLRAISPQPSFVIESGANRGHSAWIIRQALSGVRLISISPNTPIKTVENAYYFTGKRFVDFNSHNWTTSNLDLKNALILFDDHQSAFRRVFQEGLRFGFKRFIFDDNCEYQQCDALSMKWLCETRRKVEWNGYIRDNFGKIVVSQSWDEHIKQAEELDKIKAYYEFPPVFGNHRKIHPLVSDYDQFLNLVGDVAKNASEFASYAYMCYVEF